MTTLDDALAAIEDFRKSAFLPAPQDPNASAMQQGAMPQDPNAAAMQQMPPQQPMPQDPNAGGATQDPMAQIAPVMEQFMGALEQLGQGLQTTHGQLNEVRGQNASLQQELMTLKAQTAMLEKAMAAASGY